MPERRTGATVIGLCAGVCLAAVLSGCGGDSESAGPAPRASDGAALPTGDQPFELDPPTLSAEIDNRFWPMEPGTRWVYRDVDEEGNESKVVVTVSSVTKEVANGVTARVVRDTVTEEGVLVEDTFDWYAQDADGNVWYLGEDTAEYDGDEVSEEGSFEAGVDGAMAGVIMPGEPRDGLDYRQEYYAGEAEDNGEVIALGQMADTPAGHFEGTLVTADTSGIEPEVLELKFYAPGVGPVLTLGVSGGVGREELLSTTRVSPAVAKAAGTVPLGKPYG